VLPAKLNQVCLGAHGIPGTQNRVWTECEILVKMSAEKMVSSHFGRGALDSIHSIGPDGSSG